MNNLLVYYIKNDFISDCSLYFLTQTEEFIREICIVSKNSLKIPLKLKKHINMYITESDNTSCAYQTAIDNYSSEKFLKFDRILFANSDIIGPISSCKKFFNQLTKSNADVFCLENISNNQISHYLFSVKTPSLSNNIYDIIYKKTSLKYESFLQDTENDFFLTNLVSHVINDKSPFVYSEIFRFEPYIQLQNSIGLLPLKAFNYIKDKTNYDINSLYDLLIKTTKMSVLRNNLHFNLIVPETENNYVSSSKVALICYIYYEDLIEYCYKYILSMPKNADIYIITSNKKMKDICNHRFKNFPCNKVSIIQMKNQGRDVAAYLIAAREVFYNYDYICCMHDKKSPQFVKTIGDDFSYHCFETNLASSSHVSNIIKFFDENPKCGMLIPPFVNFGPIQSILSSMSTEKANVENVYKKLNLTIPFDDTPVAPLGTMFWVRGKSFLPMFNYNWEYQDFPEEPSPPRGTILHGIERTYPMAVQEAGYYVSWCSPLDFMKIYVDNMYWLKKEYLRKFILPNQETPKIHWKDVKKTIKTYIKQKFKIKKRNNKDVVTIKYVEVEDNNLLLYLFSVCDIETSYIKVNNETYHPIKELTETQKETVEYIKKIGYNGAFFKLPIDQIINKELVLHADENKIYSLNWVCSSICYNALELHKNNIYMRLQDKLYIETKAKFIISVLKNLEYSLVDKLLFLFLLVNPIHKYILFSENRNATDNAYELFKYASKKNNGCLFIASKEIKKQSKKQPEFKKIVRYNSAKHIFSIIFSKYYITSYGLNYECFPSKSLKDIHYHLIPSKWIFVPHGMAVGDKNPILINKYSWGLPYKTFCCNSLEMNFYENKCKYNNVVHMGYPRMDKWFNAKLDANKIIIFFTWRMHWWKLKLSKAEFLRTDYFKYASSVVKMIRKNFPHKKILYVFHHEVEKSNFAEAIKSGLGNENIEYISFSSVEGGRKFNEEFSKAKYLITDYSSVAYDFAYKNGAVPIYYIDKYFIAGHYPILNEFYNTSLGIICHGLEELQTALNLDKLPAENEERRVKFFDYIDNNNCMRLYDCIIVNKDHCNKNNTLSNKIEEN